MNRIPDRKRFMPRQFYKSEKYRGELEPISMMTMDFQGRYLDSQGRMHDPRVYESYQRYHLSSPNYLNFDPSCSQSYTWGPYPGDYTKSDWYPRPRRQMVFPEKFMDLSSYQMDMKGRWMDTQGRYTNPFNSKNRARRNHFPLFSPQMYSNNYGNDMSHTEGNKDTPGYPIDSQDQWMYIQGRQTKPSSYDAVGFLGKHYPYKYPPYMHDTWRFMSWPERYMDMTGYQMDMRGRWMDTQGRHCNPFNQCGYNTQGSYLGDPYDRNIVYSEKLMDRSNDRIGRQESSAGRYGRRVNPLSRHSCRVCMDMNNPYPGKMDMSNYQMDMQGRWMDTKGRYTNPFPSSGYNKQGPFHGFQYKRNMPYPEKLIDMSNYQMDMQGRWMDTQGRYTNPFSVSGYNRQVPFSGFPYNRYMHYPEKMIDMSNYQMDMQGRWMDTQGRYTNPFRFSSFPRQRPFSVFPYNRNVPYPEKMMDMSNYQMDMQGRWMDTLGRYTNPFSFGSFTRQGPFPGFPYNRNMPYPEKMIDMSNYQMDMHGRWMDTQGRYANPFSFGSFTRQGPFHGFPYNRNMPYPEKMMDMSNYQMDMQGRWMDSQGRYTNPFSFNSFTRQGPFSGFPYNRNMPYPEKMMDMSNYQMDMQGRWMDTQGRYTNPFSFSGYNKQELFPGFSYYRNMPYPEKMMDMSNYQMDMQGRWMDTQGRYSDPFSFSSFNRQWPFLGFSYNHNMLHPENMMDMSNYQMDMDGHWMDTHGRYTKPLGFSSYRRQWPFSGFPHMLYPENMMDMSNYQMDMQGRWMDMHGRYTNPFSFSGFNRQRPFHSFPYNRNMSYPENMMDMSNYQMDMQGRWMDTQGRYRNPFNQYSNYNRYGYFPEYSFDRNTFPMRSMNISNKQIEVPGRFSEPYDHYLSTMDIVHPFYNYRYSRNIYYPDRYMDMSGNHVDMQEPLMDTESRFHPSHQQGRNMNPLDRLLDSYDYNSQTDMEGRWMDYYGEYTHPSFGDQGRKTFGDYFRSLPGTYHGDTYRYLGTRNIYDRDQFYYQHGYYRQPPVINNHNDGYYGNNMMEYIYDN